MIHAEKAPSTRVRAKINRCAAPIPLPGCQKPGSMIRLQHYMALILFGMLLLTCGGAGQKTAADSKKSGGETVQPGLPEKIAPGTCRIIGTITGIDPALTSADPGNPLSKAPGIARVRVDSIIGYGSAFGNPLSAGNEITVLFKFTLSPTKDILPGMTKRYPGLSMNTTFRADVEPVQETPAGEELPDSIWGKCRYAVYGYEVIKP